MRKTLGAVSALMAAGCAMFFVFALHDLIAGDGKTSPGVLAGLTVFFGLLTLMCGGAAYRSLFTAGAQADARSAAGATGAASADDVEARILALAATNEGVVTVAEVALHGGIPLDRAE